MNFSEFFQQKAYSIHFECGRCKILDEHRVMDGPAWLLDLQIQLQSGGRRHNLVSILERAGAVEYEPVSLEDVARCFEAEVISGAGPWPELRPLLLDACRQALPCSEVGHHLDLASLTQGQLEAVDRAFSHYPGYVQRVVRLGAKTRARADVRALEAAILAWAGSVNEPAKNWPQPGGRSQRAASTPASC